MSYSEYTTVSPVLPVLKSDGRGLSDCTYLNRGTIPLRKILPAVCGVEVYKSSVMVKRFAGAAVGGGDRGEVSYFSRASRARLAFVASNSLCDFPSMMTLTFAGIPTDGLQVKKTLHTFLIWYGRRFPGHKYLWFIEFQKRGAPHFHILSTVDLSKLGRLANIRRRRKKSWRTHWDTWQEMQTVWQRLGGGMTAWEVVEKQDGAKRYAVKYATKMEQKHVPVEYENVGRFWGHSKTGVKPCAENAEHFYCSEEQLYSALQNGGWPWLSDQWELCPKELYNAAGHLDRALLCGDKPPVSVQDDIMRVTGWACVSEVLCLRDEHKEALGEVVGVFQCEECGEVFEKWRGQCTCGAFDSLVRFEGVSLDDIAWFL